MDRPFEFNGTLNSKPILLSDSKAGYICSNFACFKQWGLNFEFVYRGGARLGDQYNWLTRNLKNRVQQNRSVTLYIWLGTCDLTCKVQGSRFIALRHSTDQQCFAYLSYWVQKYEQFLKQFPTVQVIWLETPPYSISEWNRKHFHQNSSIFKDQDLVLNNRISYFNDYLRSVNRVRSVSSFRFRADLLRSRKRCAKSTVRSTVNYSLFKDGIHPGLVLSKYWARRFAQRAVVDCC